MPTRAPVHQHPRAFGFYVEVGSPRELEQTGAEFSAEFGWTRRL